MLYLIIAQGLCVNIRDKCSFFPLYQAVYHNVKPAALQQQLESIHLRQDKAEAFASAWSSMGQETIEKFRQRILAPHKVQDILFKGYFKVMYGINYYT